MKTKDLDTFDFTGWDIALFAIGSEATEKYAPKAAKAGCNRDRQQLSLPLRPRRAAGGSRSEPGGGFWATQKKNIIANPNCSTAQMVRGAQALARPCKNQARRGLRPTSRCRARARKAWTNCGTRPRACMSRVRRRAPSKFNQADRLQASSPILDKFLDSGETKEEWKMVAENQRRFLDPKVKGHGHLRRVPVFVGHSEAINIGVRGVPRRGRGRRYLRERPASW